MNPFMLTDGTRVEVDGVLDPSLPLVVLLHGLGGTSLAMTAPANAYPHTTFDRNAMFPFYSNEGWHAMPPVVPVARMFLDPPKTALTSWSAALKAAGFTTVTYSQKAPSGPLATNLAQLNLLVTEALIGLPHLAGLRVVFVGHSRGGLLARSFLGAAKNEPALSAFLSRVPAVITLHSPNSGSGLAGVVATVDALLERLQIAFTSGGLIVPSILATLRTLIADPAHLELAPGSPTLAGIASMEPVAGVTYHTFGGTSTTFARLWASVYTPDSGIPLPMLPVFHWGSTPVVAGAPLNIASFAPVAAIAQLPLVVEIMSTLVDLAAAAPELASGFGDLLVSDAHARLPFAATHTTNPLNHVEALSDPILQAQVVAILLGLRNPLVSGFATAKLSPYPGRTTAAQYSVVAKDSVTGAALTPLTVTVHGTPALTSSSGSPFTYTFKARRLRVFDPQTHHWNFDMVYPTVTANLGPPYGVVRVDTGLD